MLSFELLYVSCVELKALVLKELGMKNAWKCFRYVAQVYYKRIQ